MTTSKKRTTKSGKQKKDKAVKPSQIVVETPEGPTESDEELQKDLLDDFLFHAANYIYVRRKLFISLAVVVMVIIFSVYGAFRFVQYRDNIRYEKLYAIEKIINNQSQDEGRRFNEALRLLNGFLDSYPDSKQSALAMLHRGGLFYSQKRYPEAAADFDWIRSSEEADTELYILASIYLSNALRDQNKSAQAIEVLQSAQSAKMADVILMEIAELYFQSDQKKKAKETLDILLKDFPKGPFATKAKQLLSLL